MPDARDRYLRPGNPERDNYHPDVVPNSDEMNATGGPLNSARFRARQADAWAQNDPAKAAFHYEAVGRIKKAEAPKSTMDSLKNTLGRLSMTSAREQEKTSADGLEMQGRRMSTIEPLRLQIGTHRKNSG